MFKNFWESHDNRVGLIHEKNRNTNRTSDRSRATFQAEVVSRSLFWKESKVFSSGEIFSLDKKYLAMNAFQTCTKDILEVK